jgi:hypothetical protein
LAKSSDWRHTVGAFVFWFSRVSRVYYQIDPGCRVSVLVEIDGLDIGVHASWLNQCFWNTWMFLLHDSWCYYCVAVSKETETEVKKVIERSILPCNIYGCN